MKKTLNDYKNDINKCSKCGMCQAICPIYKLTGNDCAVSKGKFIMLDGVVKGDLKLNKNINKYLDMCAKCGKCQDFCPSNIDACKIFETAKFEYSKTNLKSKVFFFIENKLIFNNILKIFELFWKPFIPKTKPKKNITTNLLYFKGCANKIFPKSEIALKKIFNTYTEIELIEKDFDCCGIPFLSSGNLERYEQALKNNLNIIENTDFDYIITDCASCEDSLKKYDNNLKIINAINLIKENPKKFIFKKHQKITFHKPCHLKNIDFLKPILNNCENIEYIEMKDFDECCGFAGEFSIKNPKLALKMMKNKANNIKNTNADIVITLCPACNIGLKTGLLSVNSNIKVQNIIEFLATADEIK